MIEPEQFERYSRASRRFGKVKEFVKESNKIERITGASIDEIHAHLRLLDCDRLSTAKLESFLKVIQPDAAMRFEEGQNVAITDLGSGRVLRRPPPGGPGIKRALTQLIRAINAADLTPYEAHVEFETLHPFSDGNGRTGRAVWLWQVIRHEPLRDPFGLSFLHRFYYDALEAARIAPPDQGAS